MAGKALKLNPKVFDQKHGTVLDSGTTYAYLPKDAFIAFKNAVRISSFEYHHVSMFFGGSLCIILSQASIDTY